MFDKGGLLTDNAARHERLNRAARRFHPGFDPSRAEEAWQGLKGRAQRGEVPHPQSRLQFMQRMGMEESRARSFLAFVERFGLWRNPPFPGAGRVLRELRERGYRLVVVSDSDKPARLLERDLRSGGLSRLIDHVYSSSDFGKRKGEGLLAEVLELEQPDAAWFVCHADDEAEAGRRLGIGTIQLKDGSEIVRALDMIP